MSWLWRALRGHSITFAVLFACGVFGLSVAGWLRRGLAWIGAPWLLWLLVPMILVMIVAKKENTWLPDETERKKWSRRLIVGSIVAAVLIAKLTPDAPPALEDRREPFQRPGPSGK